MGPHFTDQGYRGNKAGQELLEKVLLRQGLEPGEIPKLDLPTFLATSGVEEEAAHHIGNGSRCCESLPPGDIPPSRRPPAPRCRRPDAGDPDPDHLDLPGEAGIFPRPVGRQEKVPPAEGGVLVDAELGGGSPNRQAREKAEDIAVPEAEALRVVEWGPGQVAEGPLAPQAPVSLAASEPSPSVEPGVEAPGTAATVVGEPDASDRTEQLRMGMDGMAVVHVPTCPPHLGAPMAGGDRLDLVCWERPVGSGWRTVGSRRRAAGSGRRTTGSGPRAADEPTIPSYS